MSQIVALADRMKGNATPVGKRLYFGAFAGIVAHENSRNHFAKQKPDNLRIYRELKSLQQYERPILLPVSRKTVIGDVLGIVDPADRDAGTIACVVAGTLRGASIFRVHNVRAVVQALRVIYPIVGSPEE